MRRLVWMLLLAGCAAPATDPDVGPFAVSELGRWEVRTAKRSLGWLVRLRVEAPGAREPFYRAENASGQWLGYIDAEGRVYRRVPFSMTDVFVGIRPMENALALLYEEDEPLTLVATGPEASAEEPPVVRPLPATSRKLP